MKILGAIINALLAIACGVYLYLNGEYWVGIVLSSAMICLALYCVHASICDTPTKDTENFESWKKILPETSTYKKVQWISIFFIFYTYAMYVILYSWLFGDATWWKGVLAVLIIGSPHMILYTSYAKGHILKDAREHFAEIVRELQSPQLSHLIKDIRVLTPDTPIFANIVKKGADCWDMMLIINTLVVRYQIPFASYDTELNNMWNDFVTKMNKGMLKNPETAADVYGLGIECARRFFQQHPTLGDIAVWVAESVDSKKIQEAGSNIDA